MATENRNKKAVEVTDFFRNNIFIPVTGQSPFTLIGNAKRTVNFLSRPFDLRIFHLFLVDIEKHEREKHDFTRKHSKHYANKVEKLVANAGPSASEPEFER